MKAYRVLIADDEPLARARLRVLLRGATDFAVVAEAGNGLEAVEALGTTDVDVAFLDVQMPLLDGFEVLDSAGVQDLHVVFVTAYEEHAVRAFDASAVDYLVKPFRNDRFHACLQKIRERTSAAGVPPAAAGRYARRLAVRNRGVHQLIPVEAIDWIGNRRNYAVLHVEGRRHLVRSTLSRLESRLDPQQFVRVHRSMIVNAARIRTVQPLEDGNFAIVLEDGTDLRSSRAYRQRVAELIRAR